MNAGVSFHGRLGVESIFDAIAFLGNCKDSWIDHSVEGIAWLLRAHPMPHGNIIVSINAGEQDNGDEECPF